MQRGDLRSKAIGALVLVDALVWWHIVATPVAAEPELAFLDIGQGDAALLTLENRVRILTDAGPDASILRALDALPGNRHAIDLAIISHPQADHFQGFTHLVGRYRIGAFVLNGRQGADQEAWEDLLAQAKAAHIPAITLQGGDRIRYGDTHVSFLSPGKEFLESAELNDTSFVELIHTPSWRALLTGDIGENVESHLVALGAPLRADILKVPHHGSRFSSSEAFLRAVNPTVSVVSVGPRNRYGHPAEETLDRFDTLTHSTVFRTDEDGTIRISGDGGRLFATITSR